MTPQAPPALFDRTLLRQRRKRSAGSVSDYNFLAQRAFEDIGDRVAGITRNFDRGALLGGGPGLMSAPAGALVRGKVSWLCRADLAPSIAAQLTGPALTLDEEALPFASESLDIVLAPWGLHWTNDLPGALVQINHALKPDGFFACALPGGSTLTELRQCLMAAESELTGGVAARVSPLAGTFDLAALLQRAGFAMPVADVDRVTVRYDHIFALMADLRGMGETSILADRPRTPATRTLFARAGQIYAERFADPDGRIRASFEIIHAAGWTPHPDQPKPKRPGSATHRLADALGVQEKSLGEKAGG
ncbi:methyltransferase domain-containing protein [uncultured Maricaulis sp.]|uniref:methyltransferase domain-containing protein n=1 Tax=uncultured Maricaulis sp. TaxID=174710 RepID=UPI00260B7DD3|nr:methyltransferase domain-containing protein [uncultured Maricaulis sp.]